MTNPLLVDVYAAQASTGVKAGPLRVWLRRGKLTHSCWGLIEIWQWARGGSGRRLKRGW